VLSQDSLQPEVGDKIFEEFKKMNLLPNHTKLLFKQMQPVKQGFTVLTHDFIEGAKQQLTFAQNQLNNVCFGGKNSTSNWFMHEVLVGIWTELNRSEKKDLRLLGETSQFGTT